MKTVSKTTTGKVFGKKPCQSQIMNLCSIQYVTRQHGPGFPSYNNRGLRCLPSAGVKLKPTRLLPNSRHDVLCNFEPERLERFWEVRRGNRS
jgi:hypothetical protein